ncbi:NADH-quinone oxidoreductase subunit NuoH [Zavarzinella formosa]|uniref:NADH-quinone oxidoreductase subunit NuoH n=1 Tax=Zavarzinella formosa TaxID=360055 RepID=UPI00031BDB59|nr:NADH-quinone oxidoreductase subunit NuoH [Zavarzinella formosa]
MTDFNIVYTLALIVVAFGAVMTTVGYLTLAERKISAYVQDRIGPDRAGPFGLLQPLADGIKMFFKEDSTPKHVDKIFFFLAPGIGVATALLAFSIVPFGPSSPPPGPVSVDAGRPLELAITTHEAEMKAYQEHTTFAIAPGLDIGILFSFAIGSLVVYGIILGGWSANNKYALLGSLRSSAQIISYEIPLGMSILGLILFTGSLNLEVILDYQIKHGWFILYQPLAFLLFLVSVYAECNRLPFDLPEAEQELVGGFHTEFGSMKLGLLLMVDYIHMITTSFFMAILFFGGWHLPFGLTNFDGITGLVIKVAVLGFKTFIFLMLYMLVRWTIPRFKFDQLMGLAWQVMIPLAIINLVTVMVIREFKLTPWILTATSLVTFFAAATISTRDNPAANKKRVVVRKPEPVTT